MEYTRVYKSSRIAIVAFIIGFITNLIWAIVSDQTNIYLIALIFIVSAFMYFGIWRFLLHPLSAVRKTKIKSVYDSYDKAVPLIKEKLKKSSYIRIINIGGESVVALERGGILDILTKLPPLESTQIKILMLNPSSQAVEDRFIELEIISRGKYHLDSLRESFETNAHNILRRNGKIQLRYYDSKALWRVFIIDDMAFVASYLSGKEGHETQVVVMERGSDLFAAFERMFDFLWENAKTPSLLTSQ